MKFQIFRRQASKTPWSKIETSESQFIPYQYHWDRSTICTKKQEFIQIIKVEGFSFETADDEDVDLKKMVRNSMLKSIAGGHCSMWFHVIRRRQGEYPGGKQPPGFCAELDRKWQAKHLSKDAYVNELYITVVQKIQSPKVASLSKSLSKKNDGTEKYLKIRAMRTAYSELVEATSRITSTMKDYGARLLTTYENEYGTFSEPMEFLNKLINGGNSSPIRCNPADLSHYLPINRLYFGNNTIEISGGSKKRLAAIVAIREYGPATAAGVMDGFLQLPFEFIISQSFQFADRSAKIAAMQRRQNRMINAQDKAISQIAEISDALDMATSGHIAIGKHQLSIMCFEETQVQLEKSAGMLLAELVNMGINPVREKFILEQTFWAQLPGNHDFIGRGADITTMNLAGFASYHNYPTGKIKGNHWGNAVTVFETTSGTPFFFNFHTRDVGHSTVIGPTGAGKTVLLNFLCAQAQKFNCRIFFFDKDRGAELFIRAIGGRYSIIEPANNCGFNPLQLPDTPENRTFIIEWLVTLVTTNEEVITANDIDIITDAVNGNYKLSKKDRLLRNIAPFFGIEGPGSIAGRLKMWHSGGPYSGLFDNEIDIIDFGLGNAFGFEMGEVLRERASIAPVLLYLFHRINLALDGTPTIIVLDEAWALIDNKVFASRIRDWLKTLRKLNGMVVFATQSVEDAANSSISETLIQQTATQIFLPNPKATEAYRTAFMVTERELNLLKTTDPGSRFFLVKQSSDVVVARIDLSGMDEEINILSARAETVTLAEEARAKFGEAPDAWIPEFQKKVKALKEKTANKDAKK